MAVAAEAGMQVPDSVRVGEEKRQPKGCMKMFYTRVVVGIVVVVVVVAVEDWRKRNCSVVQ
jgi:hypothetical protein